MTSPESLKLEQLDDVVIMSDEDPSRVALRVGLTCTLHVQGEAGQDRRLALARCGDDYLQRFGDNIKRFLPPSGTTPYLQYRKDAVDALESVAADTDPQSPFTPSFTGSDEADDANSYSVEIVSTRTSSGTSLCSFSATLPIAYALQRGDRPAFQTLVAGWCNTLRPSSGYAGLGVVQTIDYDERLRTSAQAFALGMRFRGLDVDNMTVVALYLRSSIKGVNWLTILGDEFVARLGGLAAMRERMGTAVQFMEFEGGVIVQAGAAPQIGDSNRENVPREYKQVSDALRPIRMSFPSGRSFIRGVAGRTNTDVSNQWLARFD